MQSILNFLSEYNPFTVVLIIFAVFFAIKEINELVNYFREKAIKREKQIISREELIKQFNKNREENKAKFAYYDEMVERFSVKVENILEKMEKIEQNVSETKEATRTAKLAELKDKIAQRYRECVVRARNEGVPTYITKMEKESLLGLIELYEANGGLNSFVHDKILVEVETWEVIENDN